MSEDQISFLKTLPDQRIFRDKIDNRGLKNYINMLFQDESSERQPEQAYEINLKDGIFTLLECAKDKVFFGGLKDFFLKGKKILDLGSGVGRATKELNDFFINFGINIFGIDASVPEQKADVVGGDFVNLPFSSNSIDRIMAVETFPRWYGDYPSSMRAATNHFASPEDSMYVKGDDDLLELDREKYLQRIRQTWEEIHRIAAPGCIFRGTVEPCREKSDYENIIRKFKFLLENGWRVIVYSEKNPQYTNFIAYLPKQDDNVL